MKQLLAAGLGFLIAALLFWLMVKLHIFFFIL